jgi:hypothetical protein
MIGQVVEFVIDTGIFLEGVIIKESEHLVVVKDREGRCWQGHPSKVLYTSGQRQEVEFTRNAHRQG